MTEEELKELAGRLYERKAKALELAGCMLKRDDEGKVAEIVIIRNRLGIKLWGYVDMFCRLGATYRFFEENMAQPLYIPRTRNVFVTNQKTAEVRYVAR
jgi:hypothetical protein